jgi:hypothetical protein
VQANDGTVDERSLHDMTHRRRGLTVIERT